MAGYSSSLRMTEWVSMPRAQTTGHIWAMPACDKGLNCWAASYLSILFLVAARQCRLGCRWRGSIMNRPRVLLADDHRMVTEGLKRLLSDDCDLVATVEDGHSLVAAAKKLRPEVIVADITMPHLNGIDAIARLKKIDPHVKVVFLTMHKNATYARRALEAGATGFVLKHSAPEELVIAIQAALKGETFVTSALAGEVLQEIRHKGTETKSGQLVTPREREILQLLAEGRSAKEIAEALLISSRTVEFHKYHMMETHGLHSSAELIHFAIKQEIVNI